MKLTARPIGKPSKPRVVTALVIERKRPPQVCEVIIRTTRAPRKYVAWSQRLARPR